MPEILAPGTGLSPLTPKSKTPTNNVHTIQDVMDGRKYKVPGGGGDWSDLWGEESRGGSYKEKGGDYKRLERDWDILSKMMNQDKGMSEEWKVKTDGGSKSFSSFEAAQRYKRKLEEKGVSVRWMSKVKEASGKVDKIAIVSNSLQKTFKVESVNFERGVKEFGGAFCVAPNIFITCAHVVQSYDKNKSHPNTHDVINNTKISLIKNGKKYAAELMHFDGKKDLALLRADINVEPFIISDDFEIGEDILTVGSPHGFENNVSFGDVGSRNKKIFMHDDAPSYMFVDMAIHSGNSGGPIIKISDGSVIGVITAIVAETGEYGLNAGLELEELRDFLKSNRIHI